MSPVPRREFLWLSGLALAAPKAKGKSAGPSQGVYPGTRGKDLSSPFPRGMVQANLDSDHGSQTQPVSDSLNRASPRPILIDTDPALMVRLKGDIDDDLAILFLLASPEVEILGITCTYGNSTIDRTFYDAQRLLREAGRTDLPVLKGAGWRTRDLNRETDASRFLAETILKRPGEITVLTLGPLTNLAAAITHHPDLPAAIPELVMMAGRLRSGQTDFNSGAHPEASDLVLRAMIPKVMVSIDLCLQAPFTATELRRLEEHSDRMIGRYLPTIRRWLIRSSFLYTPFFRLHYPGIPAVCFIPWDAITASYLAEPSLFSEIKPLKVWMEKNRIMNSKDLSGLDPRLAVRAPFRVDSRRFLDLFVERLGSLRQTRRPG